MLNRFAALLAAFVLLCMPVCVLAEPITGCGITVEREAESIDFGRVRVEDAEALCALVDQMPNLKRVDMYQSSLPVDSLEMLYEKYPHIQWGWTFPVGDHRVRTDATAFSTLHTVVPKSLHTQKQFARLKYCWKLQALDFGHNNVTDLSFLYDLPNLKILIAAVQENSVGSLEPIASLHELMYLELFNAGVTDVSPLAGLEQLEDLNLCYNRDLADISPLYAEGALPNLKRFWCGYTKVPEEQKAAMEAAHPDCIFDWESTPTRNGWRNNNRYDVLVRIFRNGVYEPLPAP